MSQSHIAQAMRRSVGWSAFVAVVVVVLAALGAIVAARAAQQATPPASASAPAPSTASNSAPSGAGQSETPIPRGKKLILKDGTFQLVREYHIEGDRVRYYGIDSRQWEEIPTALVDWDATKKEAAVEARRDAGLVASAHKQELERNAEPLDIDASVQVAPGIFLPPGQGLFAFDGKAVEQMYSADIQGSLDKKQALKQVLIPIPIVPSRHNISIQGTRSKLRVHVGQPEFYLRTTEDSEPDVDLVRVKVTGSKRQVENLDELFHQKEAVRNTIPLERWNIANGLYRYTIAQALSPGEYALLEVMQSDQNSLYVWDFAVDPYSAVPQGAAPKSK